MRHLQHLQALQRTVGQFVEARDGQPLRVRAVGPLCKRCLRDHVPAIDQVSFRNKKRAVFGRLLFFRGAHGPARPSVGGNLQLDLRICLQAYAVFIRSYGRGEGKPALFAQRQIRYISPVFRVYGIFQDVRHVRREVLRKRFRFFVSSLCQSLFRGGARGNLHFIRFSGSVLILLFSQF